MSKTKIEIIGNPGQQQVKILKMWLENSLKKFNLSLEEVYLVFLENIQQSQKIFQRFVRDFETLSLKQSLVRTKIYFEQIATTAYLHNDQRKVGTPPIILIKKGEDEIFEESILDEVAHIAGDKYGWNKLILEALGLISRDYEEFWDTLARLLFFVLLGQRLGDYFSGAMMSQYGLINEAFKERERKLNHWIKTLSLVKRESRLEKFDILIAAAFWSTLPSNYPQKEDEEKLEKIIIDHIRQMSMEPEYRKIKSIISQLKSPPNVNNIYECGAKIIELAQKFLEK